MPRRARSKSQVRGCARARSAEPSPSPSPERPPAKKTRTHRGSSSSSRIPPSSPPPSNSSGQSGQSAKEKAPGAPRVESASFKKQCDRVANFITRTAGLYSEIDDVLQIAIWRALDGKASAFGTTLPHSLKKKMHHMSEGKLLWHDKVFDFIESSAPAVLDLLKTTGMSDELEKCIKKICNQVSVTRSMDFNPIKDIIGQYAAINHQRPLDPYVGKGVPRDKWGFNHVQLGKLLCPIEHLPKYLKDSDRTRAKLKAGDLSLRSLPSFVFESSGEPGMHSDGGYDKDDVARGMFKGFLLVRVGKHIMVAPKAALKEDPLPLSCRSKGSIMDTPCIIAEHLPYLTLAGRSAMSTQQWGATADGGYVWEKEYNRMLALVWDPLHEEEIADALRYLNLKIFGHEKGAVNDSSDDNNDDDEKNNEDSFYVRLREQAKAKQAARERAQTGLRARTADITLQANADHAAAGDLFDAAMNEQVTGNEETETHEPSQTHGRPPSSTESRARDSSPNDNDNTPDRRSHEHRSQAPPSTSSSLSARDGRRVPRPADTNTKLVVNEEDVNAASRLRVRERTQKSYASGGGRTSTRSRPSHPVSAANISFNDKHVSEAELSENEQVLPPKASRSKNTSSGGGSGKVNPQ
ncbi:hypothetical protein CONPUDRAFT_148212 [Coniophora puteana RWD-64-598 SS2]|uniref:Uncharacterized protein n=1 Tax=Coniophora puteana (strain RWD-64-598) TaxID=741705 RepID=A0A5M3N4B5_CONPW|nr:uncharacterized protein CONPUDRAFT_148212 [Coniophora puteana RWD-64-598 SS2]EIW86097.1 hypothetical protein CONPUDRAFT_148212 [Coniophora puteana RWD-64-598 SS2]